MQRLPGLLLVLILTTLTTGCVVYDRGRPVSVESATLSIQTVRYGVMPINGKTENTLYVERGTFNAANADAPVFLLDSKKDPAAELFLSQAKERTATRVAVHFGAIAGNLIEIKSGLHEGDRVIVNDMSRYENQKRLLLE